VDILLVAIPGFHSDNGSEFINHAVARLLTDAICMKLVPQLRRRSQFFRERSLLSTRLQLGPVKLRHGETSVTNEALLEAHRQRTKCAAEAQ